MSIASKTERTLLSHDEAALLATSHHPALRGADEAALKEARVKLRGFRDKERTLLRGLQRSIRGKASERGGSFPGEVNKPAQRKQVFAGALKRVNGELARREAVAAQEAATDALRAALARKKAARGAYPKAPRRAGKGMRRVESKRGHPGVNPAKVGAISQANKNKQAARDHRAD